MKNLFGALLCGAVLALGMGPFASAADAPDPVVGTWVLNLAKSKFTPGPAPKSQTRSYTQDADGISLTVSGVAADGSGISQESTFKYDGKAYVFSGSADFDALVLKRVNGSTVKATLMKAGKHVGETTRTIAAHGKVLTLSTKGTDAKGVHYESLSVFDKQ